MIENCHVHFDNETLQRERTKESMGSRKKSVAEKEADIESVWSDEPYGLEERDFKKKQVRACCARKSQALLTSLDFQRMDSIIVITTAHANRVLLLITLCQPGISIDGCDLWRYRHESSICLLIHFYR
jgi:hypothetical protein